MNILYQREIPLRYNVDIFIAGGGPSGVAAAVTAARQGAKVFLAESQGTFGGTGTAGLVPAFVPFGNGVEFLAGGFGYELAKTLYPDDENLQSGGRSINVEELKRYYDNVCKNAGVDFTFFTTMMDVKSNDGTVEYVILNGKSGTFAVKAKVYIDCTGDADLCAWAGADYEMGNENGTCMPPTLCSLWEGIDWQAEKEAKKDGISKSEQLEKAIADGVFKYEDRHVPGIWNIFDRLGGGNIGHIFKVDATDERALTAAMLRGREYMLEYEKFYKEYMKGYENMYLAQTGAILGIRESRRVVGDYVLNVEDFISRANFDDEIGRFSYPVDIHIMEPTKEAYNNFNAEYTGLRYEKGESYGIPYRSLIPSKLGNVLVAGRCISTDRQMQSSIRVMPGCYITGQACGMAAWMALKSNGYVRNININELQEKLKSIGAFLPRF